MRRRWIKVDDSVWLAGTGSASQQHGAGLALVKCRISGLPHPCPERRKTPFNQSDNGSLAR